MLVPRHAGFGDYFQVADIDVAPDEKARPNILLNRRQQLNGRINGLGEYIVYRASAGNFNIIDDDGARHGIAKFNIIPIHAFADEHIGNRAKFLP